MHKQHQLVRQLQQPLQERPQAHALHRGEGLHLCICGSTHWSHGQHALVIAEPASLEQLVNSRKEKGCHADGAPLTLAGKQRLLKPCLSLQQDL